MTSIYQEAKIKDIFEWKKNSILLILTATKVETTTLHSYLKFADESRKIYVFHKGSQTYYLGVFGSYLTVHVQCDMGSISKGSSLNTVRDAIECWAPKIILMVGIAFGISNTEQNIGDVLVSDAIIPYDNKRVGETTTIQRSIPAPCNSILLNKFKNNKTWEFCVEKERTSQMILGPILSGEELIDNIERRDELKKFYPTAKGGEMEGAGLYSAADGKVPWIVIKGICDFADGSKGENKDISQNIAANASISLCLDVFSSESAFEELNLYMFGKCDPVIELKGVDNINEIVFDRYENNFEKYYVERICDTKVQGSLSHYGIWIYGPSGVGKSNCIIRNLKHTKRNFLEISLANCIGLSVDDFFYEIFLELSSIYHEAIPNYLTTEFKTISKEILRLLQNKANGKDIYIHIDEIPLADKKQFKEFTEKIIAITIAGTISFSAAKFKFVLTSIDTPIEFINAYQNKIYERITFIELDYWEESDCRKLIILICQGLNLKLEEYQINQILENSKGSPRFIKKVFRNFIARNDSDIQVTLHETIQELKCIY